MIDELKKIEKFFSAITPSQITNLIEDSESKEYFGYNFEIDQFHFKFRKSKITPKKIGQFVILWRRNSKNETEPFNESDIFDFYIIFSEDNDNTGFFLFPKKELIKRQILSTDKKEGKRGFRVYPNWTKTENKQAEKTQTWQIKFFLNFITDKKEIKILLKEILTI